MVKAAVVSHPEKWPSQTFQSAHHRWVQASLQGNDTQRQSHWTESIATGSESFVENVKNRLGFKAKGKSIKGGTQHYQLRENVAEFGHPSLQKVDIVANVDEEITNSFFFKKT